MFLYFIHLSLEDAALGVISLFVSNFFSFRNLIYVLTKFFKI
ncbi:hypothetical protein SAMN02799616_03969 [Paenibacillus sp. UNC499MF]|nr:hypothetical protein SAMN02799616_03969 [Paenibacillus sp. UNC499MF]